MKSPKAPRFLRILIPLTVCVAVLILTAVLLFKFNLFSPTDDPTETTVDLEQPPSPKPTEPSITEDEAYSIAITHAGIPESDLTTKTVTALLNKKIPRYTVKMNTKDYEYAYQIGTNGDIIKIERISHVVSGHLTYMDVTEEQAISLAKSDPLVQSDTLRLDTVTPPPRRNECYTVKMNGNVLQYEFTIGGIYLHTYKFIAINPNYDLKSGTVMPRPEKECYHEDDALTTVLQDALLSTDTILDYDLELKIETKLPCYWVTLYSDQYEYRYQISLKYGALVSSDRKYVGNIGQGAISSQEEAIAIARKDPKIVDALYLISVENPDQESKYYTLTFCDTESTQSATYQYKVKVSATSGRIDILEYRLRNQSMYFETSYVNLENGYWTVTPPEGKYGLYNSFLAARNYIMSQHGGSISNFRCELVTADNGQPQYYRIRIQHGTWRDYRFRIDLVTGEILNVIVTNLT